MCVFTICSLAFRHKKVINVPVKIRISGIFQAHFAMNVAVPRHQFNLWRPAGVLLLGFCCMLDMCGPCHSSPQYFLLGMCAWGLSRHNFSGLGVQFLWGYGCCHLSPQLFLLDMLVQGPSSPTLLWVSFPGQVSPRLGSGVQTSTKRRNREPGSQADLVKIGSVRHIF